jgi:septum formation protein
MLAWLGISFHSQPADLDETPLPGEPADEYVWRLAGEKALSDASCAQDGELVLAADTTVTADGKILGKPASPQSAAEMLRSLRGRTHQVHTAIAIYDRAQQRLTKDFCCTEVPMRAYSDEEIDSYVNSGDPLDKAGAYAIQHVGFHPVEDFTGCFASVMGMPLCHLKRSLREMGVQLEADTFSACFENLSYHCPIHQQVLDGQPGK